MRRLIHAGMVAGCLVIVGCSPSKPVPDTSGAFTASASAAIRVELTATETIDLDDRDRAALARLYESRVHAPLWSEGTGRPTADARAAVALLGAADADGLVAADYDAGRLAAASAAASAASTPDAASVARFDIQLSANMLRYLRQLHRGRVDPLAGGFRIAAPPDDHDFTDVLRAALEQHRLAGAAAEWRPPLALYRLLAATLTRYRALAASPANQPPPPEPATVKPGQAAAHLLALDRWLRALGDLPPDAPAPGSPLYEGAIVDGVKAFQSRHGLEPDGVLGKATQAALGVPLAHRVRQIELTLERLRWLPHLDARFVAVNIPMFRLWGWDNVPPDGAPSFDMNVIVGRSLDTQTPVFIDQITHIIFRPYWNVPPSILKGEVLPALARDRGYLDDQDMEIVDGQGDNASVVPLSDDALARLRAGRLRVRQRPGPKNSLGLVKFVFPNDDNIYMHGTPAPYLFSRSRRDLSHGCVRVVDPVGLALRMLADQPEWTRDRIVAAMEGGAPSRVDLKRPLQVILFYLTAVAMPEDGRVHFAHDIYGHDQALERALAARGSAAATGG